MCCRKTFSDVEALDSLRVRFSELTDIKELTTLCRYAVGKMQLRRIPALLKHDECMSIIRLVIEEAASDEFKELLKSIGGDEFIAHTIRMLCHASRGKKVTAGL